MKIADAFVEVDLRSQKLERGFRRAEQTSRSSTSKIARHAKVMGDRVGRSFARASARVGGFVAAIASVAGVAAFSRSILALAGNLDRLAKRSRVIGTTVDSLSALGFAADRATSVGADGLGLGLEVFSRGIGDAQLGMGELLPVMEAMGLSAEDFASIPIDQAFLRFADAVGQVEDRAVKLAVVQKALGRGGRGLLPLIDLGSRGIADLANEGANLTGSLSDAADMSEEINDSIGRLRSSFVGLGASIAESIGGPLADANNSIAQMISLANRQGLRGVMQGAGNFAKFTASSIVGSELRAIGQANAFGMNPLAGLIGRLGNALGRAEGNSLVGMVQSGVVGGGGRSNVIRPPAGAPSVIRQPTIDQIDGESGMDRAAPDIIGQLGQFLSDAADRAADKAAGLVDAARAIGRGIADAVETQAQRQGSGVLAASGISTAIGTFSVERQTTLLEEISDATFRTARAIETTRGALT